MWLENFFYEFEIWACVAIAFIPAAIVALVVRPFARTLVEDPGTTVLRDRVFGLASAAFVFVVALSTNTLWNQDVEVASAAREMVISGQEVVNAVEREELSNEDQIVDALDDFLRAVAANEIRLGQLLATQPVNDALNKAQELIFINGDAIDKESTLDDAFQRLIQDRGDYLSQLNQPGIPDILWVAVIVLGLLLIATFALYPIARSRRFTRMATAVAVFAVGLIQLPMWVLNSSTQVEKMVLPYIVDGVGVAIPTDPPIVGQLVASIAIAAVGTVLAGLLFYFGQRKLAHHSKAHSEKKYYSQHDLLTQIRDSLHSMENVTAGSDKARSDEVTSNSDQS